MAEDPGPLAPEPCTGRGRPCGARGNQAASAEPGVWRIGGRGGATRGDCGRACQAEADATDFWPERRHRDPCPPLGGPPADLTHLQLAVPRGRRAGLAPLPRRTRAAGRRWPGAPLPREPRVGGPDLGASPRDLRGDLDGARPGPRGGGVAAGSNGACKRSASRGSAAALGAHTHATRGAPAAPGRAVCTSRGPFRAPGAPGSCCAPAMGAPPLT
mmetsp:Transcript_67329/g.186578  ORF Transcript_67329/g.186578 Transcript_67329/m.186578 type:complete len:215 (+) Transcript_67329:571-1215(+)